MKYSTKFNFKWNEMKWNNMKRNYNEMKWNELKWNEMNWNEIKWNELKWIERKMNWNEMNWNGMNGMEWIEMEWNEMKCTEELSNSLLYHLHTVRCHVESKNGAILHTATPLPTSTCQLSKQVHTQIGAAFFNCLDIQYVYPLHVQQNKMYPKVDDAMCR